MAKTARYMMKWDEVYRRLEDRFPDIEGKQVYGIPRGGSIIAGLLGAKGAFIVYNSCSADIIVDDIIDSGATRDKFKSKPFTALVDKLNCEADRKLGWVVFPWESGQESSVHDTVTRTLQLIGEDPTRHGLLDTPDRVARSWNEMYGGYDQDYTEILSRTFDADGYDEMVVLKDIEFYSTCEHHLLPFFGKVHIAYLPDKKVVGISKLARLVDCFARRLQIQERLTNEIADAICAVLKPQGCAVSIHAQHLCMVARGVNKQNSIMTTSCLRDRFREPEVRAEFFSLVKP